MMPKNYKKLAEEFLEKHSKEYITETSKKDIRTFAAYLQEEKEMEGEGPIRLTREQLNRIPRV